MSDGLLNVSLQLMCSTQSATSNNNRPHRAKLQARNMLQLAQRQ